MRSTVVKALAFLAALGAGALFYNHYQPTANGAAKPNNNNNDAQRGVPVLVAAVEQRDIPLKLAVVGRTEAHSTVTLKSRIDGQVVALHYKPGERVRKDQQMVTLDARALEAQVRQAEANLARDQAQLDKAKSDVVRYADLLSKGFVSPATLDIYRSTVATLEATVKADQAAVDLARLQRSYTDIRAPMDGIAGSTLIHPGSMVKANDTSLVVINQIEPIYVTFSVPESQLNELGRDRAQRDLIVEARIPGERGQPARGTLVFIDNAVDAATGTIQLKGLYPNKDGHLTPGQFVEVSMTLRNVTGALLIPAEALQTGPDGTFVYVARPDKTVEVRKVRTRTVGEQRLLVEQGLVAGETVVTDGQLRLTPGATIEVRPTTRKADAASSS